MAAQSTVVDIDQLLVDENNPRYPKSNSQQHAIEQLVSDQKRKLLALAEDILIKGLNPIDPIAVLKTSDNKLIVREGNRRITALKILNNPDIIKESHPTYYNSFVNLISKYKDKVFKSVSITIFSSIDELKHWISLKHTGEQNGKGTVPWDIEQRNRFKEILDQYTPVMRFRDFLVSENIITKQDNDSLNQTMWERLMTSDSRELLGIDKIGDNFVVSPKNSDIQSNMSTIVNELKGQTHHIITNKSAREDFFGKLIKSNKIKPYDKPDNYDELMEPIYRKQKEQESKENNPLPKETSNTSTGNSVTAPQKTPQIQAPQTQKRNPRPKPFIKQLNYSYINNNNHRSEGIKHLIREINIIDYERLPIAASILTRTLLEQSLKYYAEEKDFFERLQNSKKSDPDLSYVLKYYNNVLINQSNDIPDSIKKAFRALFPADSQGNIVLSNSAFKTILDCGVHHPYATRATKTTLDDFANSGLRILIEYLLNSSGQTE